MKRFLVLVFIALCSLTLFSQSISIVSLSGTVQVKESENAEWINASVGQKLSAGFFIHTGFKSSAVVQSDTIKMEIKPLTQITVASLIKDKGNISSDVLLKYGKVKASVEKSEDVKTMFKVRTANSTASVRGTVFTFGDDTLVVENGTVALSNSNDTVVLVSGGETGSAPKMSDITSPYKETQDGYYVSTLPIGMSDSEINNIKTLGDTAPNGGSGSVIIKINVIK